MARNAKWDYIKPVVAFVTVAMVVLPSGKATMSTKLGIRCWHAAATNCTTNGIPGFSPIGINDTLFFGRFAL